MQSHSGRQSPRGPQSTSQLLPLQGTIPGHQRLWGDQSSSQGDLKTQVSLKKNASNYPKDAWLIDSKLGWTRTQSETINTRLVGGFNPPEKYWSVGLMIPNIWKIKNVPNHQPVHVATRKSNHPGQKGQKQKTQKTHHCEHAAVAQNPGARERDGSPAEVKCHPNEPSLAVIVHRCI